MSESKSVRRQDVSKRVAERINNKAGAKGKVSAKYVDTIFQMLLEEMEEDLVAGNEVKLHGWANLSRGWRQPMKTSLTRASSNMISGRCVPKMKWSGRLRSRIMEEGKKQGVNG